jgi:hypothetical protein
MVATPKVIANRPTTTIRAVQSFVAKDKLLDFMVISSTRTILTNAGGGKPGFKQVKTL